MANGLSNKCTLIIIGLLVVLGFCFSTGVFKIGLPDDLDGNDLENLWDRYLTKGLNEDWGEVSDLLPEDLQNPSVNAFALGEVKRKAGGYAYCMWNWNEVVNSPDGGTVTCVALRADPASAWSPIYGFGGSPTNPGVAEWAVEILDPKQPITLTRRQVHAKWSATQRELEVLQDKVATMGSIPPESDPKDFFNLARSVKVEDIGKVCLPDLKFGLNCIDKVICDGTVPDSEICVCGIGQEYLRLPRTSTGGFWDAC